MELPVDHRITFIGIKIINNGTKLESQVYRKSINTGLLLHFHSHIDRSYGLFIKDNATSRLCAICHNRGFNAPNCAPFFAVIV